MVARCSAASSVKCDALPAQAALGIRQGVLHQSPQVGRTQRLELKNLRAADQRPVNREEWVLGRRTEQSDRPALDIGQQRVLLRAC